MPILDVEVVCEITRNNIARRLADAAANVFESRPGSTWVKLRSLPRDNYAENGDLPMEAQPVFVSVLLGRRYEAKEYAKAATKIAEAFSKILNRPTENIHILFEPTAMGRMAFGGKLLMDAN
ncbi:MAG: hypothetical protein AABZ06_11675 [Bdellovibrionota bacterium]